MFSNERVRIMGELIQDRQVFSRSYVSQGDTDVPDESRSFNAFNWGVPKQSTKLVISERCEFSQTQCHELLWKMELSFTGLFGKAIPRTDFQAIVTAINSISYRSSEFKRDRTLVFNRQVGDTPAGI